MVIGATRVDKFSPNCNFISILRIITAIPESNTKKRVSHSLTLRLHLSLDLSRDSAEERVERNDEDV